jgi:hypothetical protein
MAVKRVLIAGPIPTCDETRPFGFDDELNAVAFRVKAACVWSVMDATHAKPAHFKR